MKFLFATLAALGLVASALTLTPAPAKADFYIPVVSDVWNSTIGNIGVGVGVGDSYYAPYSSYGTLYVGGGRSNYPAVQAPPVHNWWDDYRWHRWDSRRWLRWDGNRWQWIFHYTRYPHWVMDTGQWWNGHNWRW